MLCSADFLPSTFLFRLGPLAHGTVPSTFKVGLPFSAKPLTKCPHKHTRSVPNSVPKAQQHHLSSKLRICDPQLCPHLLWTGRCILWTCLGSKNLVWQLLSLLPAMPMFAVPRERSCPAALVANTTGSACFYLLSALPLWPN